MRISPLASLGRNDRDGKPVRYEQDGGEIGCRCRRLDDPSPLAQVQSCLCFAHRPSRRRPLQLTGDSAKRTAHRNTFLTDRKKHRLLSSEDGAFSYQRVFFSAFLAAFSLAFSSARRLAAALDSSWRFFLSASAVLLVFTAHFFSCMRT